MPRAVIKGLIKLVEDPQGTVEATLAKIKALPAYVTHAPAAFKEYIHAIQAIEDPYEQGKAVGEFMGQVLLAGGAVGKIASKLGRWRKVAKPKKRQGRIGSFKSFNNLGELGHLFRNKTLNGVSGDLINGRWKKLEGNWGTRIVFEKRIGKKIFYAQWETNIVHSITNKPVSYWKITYGKINATSKNTIRVSPHSDFNP